jgi:hypothetical protein
MRYLIIFGCVVLCSLGVHAQTDLPGYHLEGSVSLSVPVSGMKMTNLIFPVTVASAVKVSPEVKMYRPRGIRNVIELKAARRNFRPTNITVYGMDGKEYSFTLYFVEDTSVLNFRVVGDVSPPGAGALGKDRDHPILLSGLPVPWTRLDSDAVQLAGRRPFLKGSVSAGGMRLRLNGIYLRDSLLWLALRLRNRVGIGFTPSFMRIYLEDRKEIKRTASQQVPIKPIFPAQPATLPGRATERFAAGLTPFVPGKAKRMVVELSDADGGRVLALKIKAKTVLKAREVRP